MMSREQLVRVLLGTHSTIPSSSFFLSEGSDAGGIILDQIADAMRWMIKRFYSIINLQEVLRIFPW